MPYWVKTIGGQTETYAKLLTSGAAVVSVGRGEGGSNTPDLWGERNRVIVGVSLE